MIRQTLDKKLFQSAAALAIAFTLFTGCQSKQDAALDQAKKQAIATGQPQQVVSTDKNGTTTTTTVQPPAPGQATPTITTTVQPSSNPNAAGSVAGPVPTNTPATAGGVAPAPSQYSSQGQPQAQPTPGGNPVVRPADVNVPAGTTLAIRVNQHISVKTSRPGDRFDGELVDPVLGDNNRVIIPKGTPVGGIIDASHKRGRFKGASILELRLTSLTLNGTRYPLETHDLTRTKKGKGKRSAALIGGGTGLGMLIGGVASGGTGLLIGGLAGAGAGTGVAAFTGNRDLDIPSESIVRFKLADSLTLNPNTVAP
jgi:hypothetical protein